MRPWRLTRRQRVEMEAARAALASATDPRDILRASVLMGWAPRVFDRFPDDMRQWRLFRARVAIALRAALRADEDARCEEALGRLHERGASDCLCIGAAYAVDRLRCWPQLDLGQLAPDETVPLALWEVAR